VVRAKRKIKGFIHRNDRIGLTKFIASWSGHARWADTHNLVTHLEITMVLLSTINSREDLDSLAGTPRHAEFISLLKGSMVQRRNQAVYPEGYGQSGYTGPEVAADWVDVEDLSTVERYGFTKTELGALP
jgi:hypothetical protein